MGNCCRHESAELWAPVDELYDHSMGNERYHVILDDFSEGDQGVSTPINKQRQGKVITNWELWEMVAIARLQDEPVDRILSRLIHAIDHSWCARSGRSWEPVLDTIVE